MKRLAVVASNDLWALPSIASKIASELTTMNSEEDCILVRADREGKISSQVEELATRLAERLDMPWDLATPFYGSGRDGVYERDYRLVDHADSVMAFFHPERVMEGGTAHVVKAALDREKPVEAWTLDDAGELIQVGADDGGG